MPVLDRSGLAVARFLMAVLIGALIAALAMALPIAVPTPSAAAGPSAASDYRGYFADTPLAGTGWSTCAAAVTWSVDTGPVTGAAATREIRRLRRALRPWAEATGLRMRFTGQEPLAYDPASHQVTAADGSVRDRHIYITLLPEGASPLLVDPVAGFAMPGRVDVGARTVTTGMVAVRAAHVRRAAEDAPRALRGLYLHELGHVFGLGHAETTANVMHPVVQSRRDLGPGDITGVRAHLRPC